MSESKVAIIRCPDPRLNMAIHHFVDQRWSMDQVVFVPSPGGCLLLSEPELERLPPFPFVNLDLAVRELKARKIVQINNHRCLMYEKTYRNKAPDSILRHHHNHLRQAQGMLSTRYYNLDFESHLAHHSLDGIVRFEHLQL